MENTLPIAEIFGPTIQGEGHLVGKPTVFVRTGGCDFRCSWCDSLHAVLPENKTKWRRLTVSQILSEVDALTQGRPILITLSGGNPAIWDLRKLIREGKKRGHTFAMETQGSVSRAWFSDLDHLILSPKPPSSTMKFNPENLFDAIKDGIGAGELVMKVVVMNEADYQFAKRIYRDIAELYFIEFFLTPGNNTPPNNPHSELHEIGGGFDLAGLQSRTQWLVERLAQDGWYEPRIIPQLHTFIWGNQNGV